MSGISLVGMNASRPSGERIAARISPCPPGASTVSVRAPVSKSQLNRTRFSPAGLAASKCTAAWHKPDRVLPSLEKRSGPSQYVGGYCSGLTANFFTTRPVSASSMCKHDFRREISAQPAQLLAGLRIPKHDAGTGTNCQSLTVRRVAQALDALEQPLIFPGRFTRPSAAKADLLMIIADKPDAVD